MKNVAKQPDISIIMPAYQEEMRIGQSMEELADYLDKNAFFREKTIEVIVVSADSSDKTHQIIDVKQKLFKDLVFLKPGAVVGKGRDVQYGILRAKGKAIVFMDADLSTPLHHLEEFYKAYEQGSEVVVATRSLRQYRGTWYRTAMSFIGNVLFRLTGGLWIEDSQCGFKLFSENAAKLCFSKLKIMGWGFDMEILSIAKTNHLKVQAIRVNDWKHVPAGPFEDKVINNGIASLVDLAHILGRRVSGLYKDKDSSIPVGESV